MVDDLLDDPAAQAAAGVRQMAAVPEEVVKGTMLGQCDDCGERFPYADSESGRGNLDPCPECGSQAWSKWGYRMPDGKEVPA